MVAVAIRDGVELRKIYQPRMGLQALILFGGEGVRRVVESFAAFLEEENIF